MCLYSAAPVLLYGDEALKVLRIILRDSFVANPTTNTYFYYNNKRWIACSCGEWYARIEQAVKDYSVRYSWTMPPKVLIDKATTFLHRHDVARKIAGARGFIVVTR